MSKTQIRIVTFFVAAAFLLGCAYMYWTTTPLFAFQEAALAVREHDFAKFEKYVDSEKLVDSAVNDLLINPIETMPGLSEIGRRVAVAAVGVLVTPAERTLLRKIEKHISGERDYSALPQEMNVASQPDDQLCPDYADVILTGREETSPYMLVSYNTSGDLGKVLSVTRQEVTGEFEKMRKIAFDRMQSYALDHQQGLVGRLFIMARDPQHGNMSALLSEYGLARENFRGLAYSNTTDDGSGENCKAGFKFMSPKVNHAVILEIELTKSAGNWRMVRFSNLVQLIEEIDPSYAADFQGIIRSSVRGMNSQSVQNEVGAMAKRITESDAVKNFLQKLNTRAAGTAPLH